MSLLHRPAAAKAISIARAIARFFGAVLFLVCLGLFGPISWTLALLCALLGFASCVTDLSIWPALLCFAALVGQYLLIAFYPSDSLLGPSKNAPK